ncbi:CbiQ family ECF transporter T component [Brooklawnia cerclae]|uniref:Energy-coupling factor transport system permease protein n=1 Tax=Brooklawnia cerclae TaxID=349934 RepID=A0ABX0SPH8_9ACTN|nr:energy-coupling factor transport system permease protein [Brooklawnia cerclae]
MSRVLPRPAVGVLQAPPSPGARMVGRVIHPWAWWSWAIGTGIAVSLAHNPLLLVLLIAAVTFVVLQRRTTAPWARSLGLYFVLAGIIIAVRLVFQVLIGGLREGTVVFTLPELTLPSWAAGIRVGGPVTIEGLVYTVFDAGRLAGLIICIGAANALANPKRALRSVPPAFHQIATSLVIAITVAPQLVESVLRVRRARRLRGGIRKGIGGLVSIIVPVLEDAVDRSLALAAGMESRGFGRTRAGRRLGVLDAAALVGAMILLVFGMFALLGLPSDSLRWALPVLFAGLVLGVVAVWRSGRYLAVTRYRPDPWQAPDSLVAVCGLAAAALAVWLVNSEPAMTMAAYPLVWPRLTPLMVLTAVVAALPGVATPRPPQDA